MSDLPEFVFGLPIPASAQTQCLALSMPPAAVCGTVSGGLVTSLQSDEGILLSTSS